MEDTASASVSAVAGNTVSAVAGDTVSAVAGSGGSNEVDMGTVRQAMAWRVKYRVKTDSGHIKRRLPLQLLGVHPQNRGGVYPQEGVVKRLGIRLAGLGYKQEDADHQGLLWNSLRGTRRIRIPQWRNLMGSTIVGNAWGSPC